MKRLCAVLGVIALSAVAFVSVAGADQPPARTFTVVLSDLDGRGDRFCEQTTNAAGGSVVFHVSPSGVVDFKLVARNLPGDLTDALLIFEPTQVVVLRLAPPFQKTVDNGVVATGRFTNNLLVASLRANPRNFYVTVHTSLCPNGAIRGQLDEHGPLNN